jgi:hypothetical protein
MPDLRVLGAEVFDQLVASFASNRISAVLGQTVLDRESYPLLAGLGINNPPAWVPIPDAEKGPDQWKKFVAGDPHPAELDRVIERREDDIRGRRAEVEKIRIARDTARARGCLDDQPIATALNDDPPSRPLSPDDRPRP